MSSECIGCGAIENQRLYQEAFNLLAVSYGCKTCPNEVEQCPSHKNCTQCIQEIFLTKARENLGMEVAKDGDTSDRNSPQDR